MDFQGSENYESGTVTFQGDFYVTDDQGRRVVPAGPPRRILNDLKVSLKGDTSLTLDAGEAEGSWQVSIDKRGKEVCEHNHFVYIMNFGEGWVGPVQESGLSFTANHTFTKPGTYQVYAKVGCQFLKSPGDIDAHDFLVMFNRLSNTVPVEVKVEAGCPVGYWDVKMDWSDGMFEPCDEEWEFMEDGTYHKWRGCTGGFDGTWSLDGDTLTMISTQTECPYPKCQFVVQQINETCTYIEGLHTMTVSGSLPITDHWTATKRVEE
jgi:hypothetical protein